jgi:hypothetical protein
MKKIKYLLVVLISLLTITGYSQMLAPEDPGGEPGTGDDPIGGSAPIGPGMIILLSLGAAYGSKKIYNINNSNEIK